MTTKEILTRLTPEEKTIQNNLEILRKETRRQRYNTKISTKLPISLATINFIDDKNLGALIRAATCFGAAWVDVIGSLPNNNLLKTVSGTTSDYISIESFSRIEDFISARKEHNIVCAEITRDSTSVLEYEYDFSRHTCIVVGNETIGVPGILTLKYPTVYIPMLGSGFCLNNSQAANVMLFDYMTKYLKNKNF